MAVQWGRGLLAWRRDAAGLAHELHFSLFGRFREPRMFRLALAACFLTTTVAGPWLCCCTASAWAEAGRKSGAVQGASAKLTPACCCQEQSNGQKQDRSPAGGCPCQQHRTQSVLMTVPAACEVHGLTAVDWPSVATTSSSLATQPSGPLRCVRECAVFPYMTGREVLRAVHVLRC